MSRYEVASQSIAHSGSEQHIRTVLRKIDKLAEKCEIHKPTARTEVGYQRGIQERKSISDWPWGYTAAEISHVAISSLRSLESVGHRVILGTLYQCGSIPS